MANDNEGPSAFEKLAGTLMPEDKPSTHLDVAQNFRLFLQDMPNDEFESALKDLRTPSGDCTLREELVEWAGLLYWKGFLREYIAGTKP